MIKYYLAARKKDDKTLYYSWSLEKWVAEPYAACYYYYELASAKGVVARRFGTHVEVVEVSEPVPVG